MLLASRRRWLDKATINLGFSGNAWLEVEVAQPTFQTAGGTACLQAVKVKDSACNPFDPFDWLRVKNSWQEACLLAGRSRALPTFQDSLAWASAKAFTPGALPKKTHKTRRMPLDWQIGAVALPIVNFS